MRVLFVDDEPEILEQAEIFLERKEFGELEVETAVSAEEGLELLEEGSFEVVVSDYQMPEMDGLEFLKTVRDEMCSDIPFIVFTGKGREEVAMEALNLGADRYLQKGGDPKSQYGVLAQAIVQEWKHKRTKFERSKLEAEFSSLVEGAEDPIFTLDEDCRIIFANQAELDIHGLDLDEMVGRNFHELHDEEDAESLEKAVEKALSTGEAYREEVENGTHGAYIRTVSPIQNPETGEVDKVSVISKDISERKEIEEDLREREMILSDVVEGNPIPTFVLDKNHEIIFWNEALEDFSGIRRREIIGTDKQWKAFYEKARPVLADLIIDGADESLIEDYYGDNYSRSILKDAYEVVDFFPNLGERGKWLHFTAAPIKDKQDNIAGAIETLQDITERREAEEKLRKSEQEKSLILESSPDLITYQNLDHEVIWTNERAAKSTNEKPSELVGRKCYEIWHNREEPCEECPVEKATETGRIQSGEIEEPDGTTLLIFAAPVEDERGELIGILETALDITERKKLREKLEFKTGLLNDLMNNTPDMVYFKDKDTRFIEVSQSKAEEVDEPERDNLYGKTDFDYYPKERAEKSYNDDLHVIEQEEPLIKEEEKHKSQEGEEYWLEATKVPRYDDEGNVIGILGISRDITGRKKAEEKLNQYKIGIEASKDSIYMVDGDYRYIFANDEHISRLLDSGRISQKNEEEIIGKRYREVHPNEIAAEFEEKVDKVIRTKETQESEYKFPNMGRWSFRIYSPIIDGKSGKVEEVIIVSKDITDKKKAEKRKNFLHSLLRHDMRNKIQIIQGYHELLKEFDLSEEARCYLEKAAKTARDGVNLIEKVRTLRKTDEKHKTEKTEIGSIIKNVISKIGTQKIDKNIKIEIKYENLDFEVQGGTLLEELFLNIIENSIKHAGCDKILISGSEKEEKCIVTVEDDGKGIPDKMKDKVFQRGYKGESTEGTGLGLSLARRIAENYGGNIEVWDSDLGGARFDVFLKTI